MCGIVGAASARNNTVLVSIEGLRRLEYRGYDACGVAVLAAEGNKGGEGGGLQRVRGVARVAELGRPVRQEQIESVTGIAPHALGHARRADGGQRAPGRFVRRAGAGAQRHLENSLNLEIGEDAR